MQMIRILKLYFLSIIVILNAGNLEQEIGINIGLNSTKNENGNKFENPSLGFSYQDNKYIVAPRIDIDYTKVKNDYASSLIKVSVNGVYEYENSTVITPYALAGVGYEYVNGGRDKVFESNTFIQAGGGFNADLTESLKVGVEGKVLQIIGGHNESNEFMLTAGVSMPISSLFGNEKKVRQVVKENFETMPPLIEPILMEPTIVPVNNNECSIKINAPDLDRDGVSNSKDQCPATPCSFTVDQYGCPIKTTLKINFSTNSSEIRTESMFRIAKFSDFLLVNKGSNVKIIGHTDSVGSATHNLSLSLRRAKSVVNELISRGVSPSRLEVNGLGESMPLASNKTLAGKAINRRIEAELFYPRGRK
jgi:OOP family OmpA-OmpF porin